MWRRLLRSLIVEEIVVERFDPNTTWNKIASCIKRVDKDELGESQGGTPLCKDTSWWNEEVKAAIKIK